MDVWAQPRWRRSLFKVTCNVTKGIKPPESLTTGLPPDLVDNIIFNLAFRKASCQRTNVTKYEETVTGANSVTNTTALNYY